MPQKITLGYKALCEAAEREIETVSAEQALDLHCRDDAVLVDIRDVRELQREGRVPGAFHCPRGMLEFWIDPESPYHKPVFAADKKFVFFCAGGLRSALAAQTDFVTARARVVEPLRRVLVRPSWRGKFRPGRRRGAW